MCDRPVGAFQAVSWEQAAWQAQFCRDMMARREVRIEVDTQESQRRLHALLAKLVELMPPQEKTA